jgi:hypothetical protein
MGADQWDATATLLNGDSSYFNRGFHVITMRWGRVYSLDVFEDSQEVARAGHSGRVRP